MNNHSSLTLSGAIGERWGGAITPNKTRPNHQEMNPITDYKYIRKLLHSNIQMNPEHEYSLTQGSWNHVFQRQERTLTNMTTGGKVIVYSTTCEIGDYCIL